MKGLESMMQEVVKSIDVPAMLNKMGIDLPKLNADIESWRLFVVKTLSGIDAKLESIDKKSDELLQEQKKTNELLQAAMQSGDATSDSQLLSLVQELVSWKRQQMYLQLNPQAQPRVAQPVPSISQPTQPANPQQPQ